MLRGDGASWLSSQIRISRTTSGSAAHKVVLAQFYTPHPKRGRQPDTMRWRGLVVIWAADGPNRHVIGCRILTLLVASDTLRFASSEEAAAAEVVRTNSVLGW